MTVTESAFCWAAESPVMGNETWACVAVAAGPVGASEESEVQEASSARATTQEMVCPNSPPLPRVVRVGRPC